jgi:hypothetical protein
MSLLYQPMLHRWDNQEGNRKDDGYEAEKAEISGELA